MKQKFKSNGRYFKIVKDISVELSVKLKVEVLRAKCFNSSCKVKSFTTFSKGIERYSRTTQRLKQEAICGLINDNSTTPGISRRFKRIFNTTGSKSSIDRWKHKEESKLDIKEIISKLNFSGILCIPPPNSLDKLWYNKRQTFKLKGREVR
jgi:hypothetical protein